ncbi:MAG: hypothetical protein P8X63_04325 [Desulfuromonadaceae bacterium]|jgi:hypothetical protein
MVPIKTHPKWVALVTGKIPYTPKLLGLKILLNVVAMNLKKDSSPKSLEHNINEVRNFFVQHEKQLETDIKQIFG